MTTRAAPKRDPESASDAELIARCLARDEDAWRTLITRYARLIQAVARRTGLDSDGVEEVFQWVSVTLARRLEILQDPDCLPKWLIVTTMRRARRVSIRLSQLPVHVPLSDRQATRDESVEEQLLRDELRARVQSALARLGPRDQAVLRDMFERELPYTEIAKRHGMRVGSLGSLRSRALARLRRLLDDGRSP